MPENDFTTLKHVMIFLVVSLQKNLNTLSWQCIFQCVRLNIIWFISRFALDIFKKWIWVNVWLIVLWLVVSCYKTLISCCHVSVLNTNWTLQHGHSLNQFRKALFYYVDLFEDAFSTLWLEGSFWNSEVFTFQRNAFQQYSL